MLLALFFSVQFLQNAIAQEPGERLWQREYGGAGDDVLHDLAPALGGGWLAVGQLGAAPPDSGGQPWLLRVNSEGDTLWTRTLATPGDGALLAVAPLGEAGWVATGYADRGAEHAEDLLTVAVDSEGQLLWLTWHGGEFDDRGRAVIVDGAGHVVIAGYAYTLVDSRNYFLVKLTPTGETLLERDYATPGWDFEQFADLFQRGDGEYMTTGTTHTGHPDTLNLAVGRFFAGGNPRYLYSYGGDGVDHGHALVPFEQGAIVAGERVDGDQRRGWLLMVDETCDSIHTALHQYGEETAFHDLARTPEGGLAAVGTVQYESGGVGALVLKTSITGQAQWVWQAPQEDPASGLNAVKVTGEADLVAAGWLMTDEGEQAHQQALLIKVGGGLPAVGRIEGTVFSSQGGPIEGCRVELYSETGEQAWVCSTDAVGAYLFEELPFGVYRISPFLWGFEPGAEVQREINEQTPLVQQDYELAPVSTATIAELQVQGGSPPWHVQVEEAVITVPSYRRLPGYLEACAQDGSGWGVLLVAEGNSADTSEYLRGEKYRLQGVVSEGVDGDGTRLTVYRRAITGTGQPMPEPIALSTGELALLTEREGSWARAAGELLSDPPGSGSFLVELDDGSGAVGVQVDELAAFDLSLFQQGDWLAVHGALRPRSSAGDEVVLLPGVQGDFAFDAEVPDMPEEGRMPGEFLLGPAWPNPFNGHAQVKISLPGSGRLELALYDLLGRRVAMVHRGWMVAGTHTLTLEATGLPSGSYYLTARYMRGEGKRAAQPGNGVRRLLLVR